MERRQPILRVNAMSLEQIVRKVKDAFYSVFDPKVTYWVVAVFPDHLIVEEYVHATDEWSYFQVGYQEAAGGATFAERETWTAVEKSSEWLATNQAKGWVAPATLRVHVENVRRETVGGAETLIVHGTIAKNVMNGEYFPAPVFERDTPSLNDCAIVIGHPQNQQGLFVAVKETPDVLKIGRIYNAAVNEKGRPACDFYFDVATAAATEDGQLIIDRAESGEPIEVSIGVMMQTVALTGEIDGEAFSTMVTGFTGDHVAVLPNEIGACSVDAGCGVGTFSNKDSEQTPGWARNLVATVQGLFSADGNPPQSTGESTMADKTGAQPNNNEMPVWAQQLQTQFATMAAKVDLLAAGAEATEEKQKADLVNHLTKADVGLSEATLNTFSVAQLQGIRNDIKATNRDGVGGGGAVGAGEKGAWV